MQQKPDIGKRIYAAKSDAEAADAVIREYLPFIKAEASKALGGRFVSEQDDEMGIAMFAFHEAIESYSRLRGAFFPYASLLIRRKLIDYHRRQKKHDNVVSLDIEQEGRTLRETVPDERDAYDDYDGRTATQSELAELRAQLAKFSISLSDIADNCPKQGRTYGACRAVLQYAVEHNELIRELLRTGRLPVAALSQGAGVERKVLERHRKYIVALLIIHTNGYVMLRDHIKQVLQR